MDFYKLNSLYIEVTHACNQHCRHCYLDGGIHRKNEEMSTGQIKSIFAEFKNQGGKYVVFTGGEPLMRSDMFELLDCLDSLELRFTFASNSLGMNRERLEKLASYKGLAEYFTSILGENPEKHKAICGKDSFDSVINAVEFFDKKDIPSFVQVTLANDYIDDMETILEKLSAFKNCSVKITPIASLGCKSAEEKEADKNLIVPPERFEYFHKKLDELCKKYPNCVGDDNIYEHDKIVNMINEYKENPLYSLCWHSVCVRPNGDLSFSYNMNNPYVFGKAFESLKIPMDEKFFGYINLLKKADEFILEESEKHAIEYDTAVDNYISVLI
ncbi:MAG: radical SAM protein [Oscillospiraceae bacterium]|nr:radical SAM protein [Oscillospiraceae bacterium]MBQ3499902.1 radical SAM protein [Oscillospiraceae bacterium]MBQ6878475.1 radical SAM protein [Oscillospiraceae bacterium]